MWQRGSMPLPCPARIDRAMAAPASKTVRQFLSSGLSLLRGVTGDDAYDKYLAHMQASAPQETPLNAREFYRAQMENKWSCISGCC